MSDIQYHIGDIAVWVCWHGQLLSVQSNAFTESKESIRPY